MDYAHPAGARAQSAPSCTSNRPPQGSRLASLTVWFDDLHFKCDEDVVPLPHVIRDSQYSREGSLARVVRINATAGTASIVKPALPGPWSQLAILFLTTARLIPVLNTRCNQRRKPEMQVGRKASYSPDRRHRDHHGALFVKSTCWYFQLEINSIGSPCVMVPWDWLAGDARKTAVIRTASDRSRYGLDSMFACGSWLRPGRP